MTSALARFFSRRRLAGWFSHPRMGAPSLPSSKLKIAVWIVGVCSVILLLLLVGQTRSDKAALAIARAPSLDADEGRDRVLFAGYVAEEYLACRADAAAVGRPEKVFLRGDRLELVETRGDWARTSRLSDCWIPHRSLSPVPPGINVDLSEGSLD